MRRIKPVVAVTIATYGSVLVVLNTQWYRNYPHTSFHLFDDTREWLQMDKAGHVFSAYQLGKVGIKTLKWSGVGDRKAIFYGGSEGLIFLTAIEVFDGFSDGWGFSVTDLVANFTGAGILIGQELLWRQQKIQIKFSFHRSDIYIYRPGLLGDNLVENILKDYNGQSYWLSVNIYSFLNENSKFPKWLNIALGYGADRMVTGSRDLWTNDGTFFPTPIPDMNPYRRFFLSLDIDLHKIRTKSKFVNTFLDAVNFIKIPFPAIEFSRNRLSGHYFYF